MTTASLVSNLESGFTEVMSCHYSSEGDDSFCIGWLYNQLGEGNNIGLRIHMRDYENLHQLTVDGEQHQRFEDTLPPNP